MENKKWYLSLQEEAIKKMQSIYPGCDIDLNWQFVKPWYGITTISLRVQKSPTDHNPCDTKQAR